MHVLCHYATIVINTLGRGHLPGCSSVGHNSPLDVCMFCSTATHPQCKQLQSKFRFWEVLPCHLRPLVCTTSVLLHHKLLNLLYPIIQSVLRPRNKMGGESLRPYLRMNNLFCRDINRQVSPAIVRATL